MADIIKIDERDRIASECPMGMREMQYKVYARKESQYILIKAPPASGKSRALMYLALDKLNKQGIAKVIITVPEQSIGGSFKSTKLSDKGFPWDWVLNDKYDLCGDKQRKSNIFASFLNDKKEKILICPHQTFRNAIKKIDIEKFDGCLIAIDEFHHATTEKGNVLGNAVEKLMERNKIHLIAMTGSYIRGDGQAILTPNYERKFDIVDYTFYEQLCSFKYLKGVSYDYRFYTDVDYINPIKENINLNKKTIIYLPSATSTLGKEKNKNEAVKQIYDFIGKVVYRDPNNLIDYIKTKEGKVLKVCNFVNDIRKERNKYISYTSDLSDKDSLDIIIALNMAKEGFDWPWCEEVIVTNYRGSPTEVIQIFGRVSRDCIGKEEGKFTYLIPRPELGNNEIANDTDNLLKAIVISLLMKNIAAKKHYFVNEEEIKKPDGTLVFEPVDGRPISSNIVVIKDEEGGTERAKDIINNHQKSIIEEIVDTCPSIKELILNEGSAELLVNVEIPKVIQRTFDDIDDIEVNFISKSIFYILSKIYGSKETITFEPVSPQFKPTKAPSLKFISVDDYYVNTIKEKNILGEEYQILSRSIDKDLLLEMANNIRAKEEPFTDQEAMKAIPEIIRFKNRYSCVPNPNSKDKYERRLGYMAIRVRDIAIKRKLNQGK